MHRNNNVHTLELAGFLSFFILKTKLIILENLYSLRIYLHSFCAVSLIKVPKMVLTTPSAVQECTCGWLKYPFGLKWHCVSSLFSIFVIVKHIPWKKKKQNKSQLIHLWLPQPDGGSCSESSLILLEVVHKKRSKVTYTYSGSIFKEPK